MSEIQKTINTTYIIQIVEAVNQFTAHYVNYSTSMTELKQGNQNIPEEALPQITQAISQLRVFEKHAYLRLNAIAEARKINMSEVKKLRDCLNDKVPHDKNVELLVEEYQKILATKITDDIGKSTQQEASELIGDV